MTYNRQPKPTETIHSFRIDLREYFGKFDAGDYEVYVTWPASGFTIRGLPGDPVGELRSATMMLRVVEKTSVPANAAIPSRKADIPFVRDGNPAAISNGPLPTGTVTNNLREPISFPVLPAIEKRQDAMKPPFRLKLDWCRVIDSYPMKPADPDGYKIAWDEKERLPFYTLKPQQSVKVVLPDWMLDGDGTYYYSFFVYTRPDGRRVLAKVSSDLFTIDGFGNAENAAAVPTKPSKKHP